MLNLINHCVHDPLTTLYLLQCATYATGAFAVWREHHSLRLCYGASALIHAGFAAAHLLPPV